MSGLGDDPSTAYAALRVLDDTRGGLPLPERLERLASLERALLARRERLVAALAADFGARGREETLVAELLATLNELRHARRRLRRWARPRRVGVALPFWPARAWIVPQPLGVVAILSPWNYPVQLSLVPSVAALAAGNRVVLKPSETTPRTAEELADLVDASVGGGVVRTVLGGPELAAALVRLPFDHLLFTGSTARGREVMRAAAEHGTPLTLELGGKCPAILMPDADLERAARSLVLRKGLNAGQTCVAPDTLLVVGQPVAPVRAALRNAFARAFPEGLPTAVLPAQASRLASRTADLALEPLSQDPRTLLLAEPPPDHPLLREEVFGPVLPLAPMPDLTTALGWIKRLPAPLAVYLYTKDSAAERTVLDGTRAGALVVNDAMIQAAMPTLPFGGVGASGFGRYRGRAGFDTFSNLRVHLRAAPATLASLLDPPADRHRHGLIDRLLRGRFQAP